MTNDELLTKLILKNFNCICLVIIDTLSTRPMHYFCYPNFPDKLVHFQGKYPIFTKIVVDGFMARTTCVQMWTFLNFLCLVIHISIWLCLTEEKMRHCFKQFSGKLCFWELNFGRFFIKNPRAADISPGYIFAFKLSLSEYYLKQVTFFGIFSQY